ncbi:transcriptional regulator (plasmid) [Halorarum halophilum]|uniref:Transcriptional regulator n=1 Tax=Halorarum halophilum TaxID=2743090 RepID=A0A7D5GKJ8_9EURY|nr:transcriptional regulator [Halobaculum halophilum]QLG29851.1 transcriptional regulator [Halobaculum halophilum]
MAALKRRYSTGLTFLNSRLDGGIPSGKLLTLTAPAGSQSELLLYHLATSQPMLYISTTNPAEAELRAAIEGTAIQSPFDLDFMHATPRELLENSDQYLERIRPESFVVIDSVDGLERTGYDQFLSFVNGLKNHLRETDSVGVFHALDTEPMPESRRLTLKRTDYVWRLEQLVNSREINNRLLVTKARGGRALTEPIPLVISDHVRVDTSRRIA